MEEITIRKEVWEQLQIPCLSNLTFNSSSSVATLQLEGLGVRHWPGLPYSYFWGIRLKTEDEEVERSIDATMLLPPTIQEIHLDGWLSCGCPLMDCHRLCLTLLFPESWQAIAALQNPFRLSYGRRLEWGTTVEFGDIVCWMTSKHQCIHSAMAISPTLLWSKNGEGADHIVCIQDIRQLVSLYAVPDVSIAIYRPEPGKVSFAQS